MKVDKSDTFGVVLKFINDDFGGFGAPKNGHFCIELGHNWHFLAKKGGQVFGGSGKMGFSLLAHSD